MGQQQLLLLVLATVIVGLATVAGIQAFEQGSKRANQDALTNMAVKIASDAQANLMEPEQFGGAGASDESDLSSSSPMPDLGELGYETSSSKTSGFSTLSTPVYSSSSGECSMTTGGGGGKGTGDAYVVVNCESAESTVQVEVEGLSSEDIVTESQSIKS